MDKRKQKKAKRLAAAVSYTPPPICSNCGKRGLHFVPPSFGDAGFFACTQLIDPTRRPGDQP